MVDDVFEAIAAGDGAALAALLARRPPLAGARDASGVSALMFAVYRRRSACADALLRAGAPVDVFEAAALSRLRTLDELTRAEPGCARATSSDGFTPLHLACFFGGLEEAALLRARGADVEAVAQNPSRVRPLHGAAASRRSSMVALVLAAGAMPDAAQHGGWTALHAAVRHRDEAMARVLLASGADPARAADDGSTAFTLANGVARWERLLRGEPLADG